MTRSYERKYALRELATGISRASPAK
jgi:hypothetical protein